MKKVNFKSLNKFLIILLLAVILVSALSLPTLAYFKFSKTFDGTGNLPILKINYTINTNDKESLRDIVYNGQSSESVSVNVNTNGNNVSGKVRAKVSFVWSNSLNNTPYNKNNELINACSVNVDEEFWEQRNGFYYLKQTMPKNTEQVLFSSVIFGEELTDDYRGENVDIYVVVEIYQDYNLPTNW